MEIYWFWAKPIIILTNCSLIYLQGFANYIVFNNILQNTVGIVNLRRSCHIKEMSFIASIKIKYRIQISWYLWSLESTINWIVERFQWNGLVNSKIAEKYSHRGPSHENIHLDPTSVAEELKTSMTFTLIWEILVKP